MCRERVVLFSRRQEVMALTDNGRQHEIREERLALWQIKMEGDI
jgi:hypothetical protein